MRCLACFSNLIQKGQFLCAINPVIGHETEDRIQLPPARKKKVLVAGGGIAGMQAALTASERGHEVILAEKSGSLGGALRCEEAVPFKKHLAEYLERQARFIGRAAVDVRLNTPATPELAEELRPDVIIAALGARPVVPNVRGSTVKTSAARMTSITTPKNPEKTLILAAPRGCELGITLRPGRPVTVVEMLDSLNDGAICSRSCHPPGAQAPGHRGAPENKGAGDHRTGSCRLSRGRSRLRRADAV
jgi:pyruvate/2-oxoglutarate dehydrogenase complex dihydrolipoamide dehydrogenase (E3) component